MSGSSVFRHVCLESMPEAQVSNLARDTLAWLRTVDGMHECGPLELMTQSMKSLVWSSQIAGSGARVVVKRYVEAFQYQSEIGGYLIFRGGPIAQVLHHDAVRQTIVFSHLTGRPPHKSVSDLNLAICAYASMHEAAMANISLGSEGIAQDRDSCSSGWGRAECIRYPVSVGDVKPEHVIVTREGARIIDLETWSLQRTVWFDVLSLARFLVPGMQRSGLEWLVHRYCYYRGCPSDAYEMSRIERCWHAIRDLSPDHDYVEGAAR
ncbi:hypothetical protein DLD99_13415 [Pseudomonas kribbensis]|uniref:Uncharacterized protein n=1 Tax=Pseudomonas kribbensis TaxID=1628086 RepID=A0A345RQ60_9PSED|nr:hypothetical protein [Pseudomonas kribbensis]AXI61426.1 hypothetical protein DLD99_13415 [Pseudomonas kribbensis]